MIRNEYETAFVIKVKKQSKYKSTLITRKKLQFRIKFNFYIKKNTHYFNS